MWSVRVEFALQYEGDAFWDTHEQTFIFEEESEARVFCAEARAVAEAGWEDELDPSPAVLDFPRKHSVTLYDLEGTPDGGFLDGEAVGGYKLALLGVVQATEFKDLTDVWR